MFAMPIFLRDSAALQQACQASLPLGCTGSAKKGILEQISNSQEGRISTSRVAGLAGPRHLIYKGAVVTPQALQQVIMQSSILRVWLQANWC